MSRRILKNAAECALCHTVVESRSVHDFVSCKCGAVAVDGGREYVKRSYRAQSDIIEMTEYGEEITPPRGTPGIVSGPTEVRATPQGIGVMREIDARSAYPESFDSPAVWGAKARVAERGLSVSMRRVIVESPYAGNVEKNTRYLRMCLLDSLVRGEAPFASHALYPLVLDDAVKRERSQGMAAGFAWAAVGELTAVYDDLGISPGMALGIDHATALGRPVETRRLGVCVECLKKLPEKLLMHCEDCESKGAS